MTKRLPDPPAKVHFIGIGGISMNGLAQVLHSWGYSVSGADASESPTVVALRNQGIQVVIGHDDPTLAAQADVLVTTLRAAVNARTEIEAASAHNALIIKRGELIGLLGEMQTSIAVAGSHGKSTTSGMVTMGLRALGKDPTYALGAVLAQTGRTVAPGSDPYLVAEADEFDRAFLYLTPDVGIVNPVSFDHPDIYTDQQDYDDAFSQFIRGIKPGGRLVISPDDPGSRRVLEMVRSDLQAEVVTYGELEDADYRLSKSLNWSVTTPDGSAHEITPTVPGDHNVRNSLAAAIAIEKLGFPFAEALPAVCSFAGVQRRFEYKGEQAGVVVIDDYAHHPDEIEVNLKTCRQVYPDRRLVVVHQPHTFSRTRALLGEFAQALGTADLAVIMDIYGSSETDNLGISSQSLIELMPESTVSTGDPDATVRRLVSLVKPGDLVITMGAGTITEVGNKLLHQLANPVPEVIVKDRKPLRIQEHARMSLYTTMRVGGTADVLIRASTREDLLEAYAWGVQRELPVTVMGGGSNLLVSDAGIRGLTIIVKSPGDAAVGALEFVDQGDSVLLTAPAQAPISAVGRFCAEHGWAGMDWAVGLPGQIGGATVNNAGAHSTELKDHLIEVTLLTDSGEIVQKPAEWLAASYRMTRIKGTPRPRPWIVLSSTFRLPKGDSTRLVQLADDHADFRKRTQPSGPCSGSTFANPPGDYAGRLLEVAGMKGFTLGGMQYSTKHANWVVNTGTGTASEAWELILHGQEVIRDQFGVVLRPEVERVGEGADWEIRTEHWETTS